MINKKTCNCCQTTKPLTAKHFGRQRSGDGYTSQCKECISVKAKARREAKKDGTFVSSRVGPAFGGNGKSNIARAKAKKLIILAQARAKKKGLDFSITSEEIEEKLNYALCEKTGIPFDFSSRGDGSRSIYTPTLDRIDPELGYTSANTQVVVMAYNGLKSNGTDFQAVQVARALIECHDSQSR